MLSPIEDTPLWGRAVKFSSAWRFKFPSCPGGESRWCFRTIVVRERNSPALFSGGEFARWRNAKVPGLFEADLELEHSRWHLAQHDADSARKTLDKARDLIASMDYGRRRPEVEALEAGLAALRSR